METNFYALEMMVAQRLADARAEARRLDLLAQRPRRRAPLRVRLGRSLIALGEWLRCGPVLTAARSR